jgi:hexosaminidase
LSINALLSSVSPVSKTLKNTKHPEQILGIEGALWTDIIPSYSQLQYMAFPKIAGLAEAAWSYSSYASTKPQWQSLANRLGCGKTGFLAYLNQTYSIIYRGYPNGIKLEAPLLCN